MTWTGKIRVKEYLGSYDWLVKTKEQFGGGAGVGKAGYWRDGSSVKAFASLIEDQVQFPQGSLKQSATSVSGDPTPSLRLCRHSTPSVHTYKQAKTTIHVK